jgi:DNA-binding response OmpR family regulator
VELDISRHEALVRGTPTLLPPREFDLPELLLACSGRLLTRDFLISTL